MMKKGFLLTTDNKKRRSSRNEGGSDSDPSSVLRDRRHDKTVATTKSGVLLDLEAVDSDGAISKPSLFNVVATSEESTCRGNDRRDDEASDCKQPIMVEIDDRPITIIAEKKNDDVGSTTDSANVTCKGETNAPISNDTAAHDTANEMDSFAFANEVSRVLTRLRRALKSNNQSRRIGEKKYSLNGVRQFMNQKSEQFIKTFVEKHICLDETTETKLRLGQLWQLILEEIAQECHTSTSKKKKKELANSHSSQFALGIGILEFSKPDGVALDSIADLLSNLADSIVQPNSCDQEIQKRQKLKAVGAIFLLQRYFRCISVEASDEQTTVNATTLLLDKIIPALHSIASTGEKRTYLSSTAADAFFELIEILPRVQSTTHVIWKEVLPRIEEMINVKRRHQSGGVNSNKRVTPTLFCNAPCNVILPPILDYMSNRYATSGADACSTSLSCIICNMMEANAKENADDFVRCLIVSAQQHENCKLIFENNGESWRSLLLESDEDSAYRNVLLAAAKSMVDMPSSTIPLSLFSCLVGVKNNSDLTDSERKILIATASVVRFAVDELKLSREVQSGDDQTVFKRFTPLLILRRLSKAYYQILHNHIVSNIECSRTVMYELATELANEIRAHALKNDEGKLAREEKVLLAQVAGHCLPLSIVADLNESPVALFDLFEKPFSATLDEIKLSESSPSLESIHESKLALFAVCQHIPGACDDDLSGNAIVKVALYVVEFLNESQTNCEEVIEQEVAKLQTGCLHFLGVVFDSLFARKAKKQIDGEENNCKTSFLGGLIRAFELTSSILFNGAVTELEGQCFSASTRISIFNAMVIYSQSCTTKDGRLALFASELLPALMKWVDEAAMDNDIRHPLCVAASLQLVYTILAKLGSFDWAALGSENELQIVRLTFRCALKSLCRQGEAGIIRPLRLVSMKVILTVIAIKQNLVDYIKPDEIQHAVTAVRDIANKDGSQDVRQLALTILPHLDSIDH